MHLITSPDRKEKRGERSQEVFGIEERERDAQEEGEQKRTGERVERWMIENSSREK